MFILLNIFGNLTRWNFFENVRSIGPLLADLGANFTANLTKIPENCTSEEFCSVRNFYCHLFWVSLSNFVYGRTLLKPSSQQHHFYKARGKIIKGRSCKNKKDVSWFNLSKALRMMSQPNITAS